MKFIRENLREEEAQNLYQETIKAFMGLKKSSGFVSIPFFSAILKQKSVIHPKFVLD